jgi:predicted Zn-dependent peptidase
MSDIAALFAQADAITDHRTDEEKQVLADAIAAVHRDIEDLVRDGLREAIALDADERKKSDRA